MSKAPTMKDYYSDCLYEPPRGQEDAIPKSGVQTRSQARADRSQARRGNPIPAKTCGRKLVPSQTSTFTCGWPNCWYSSAKYNVVAHHQISYHVKNFWIQENFTDPLEEELRRVLGYDSDTE